MEFKNENIISPAIVLIENAIENSQEVIDKSFEKNYATLWRDSKIVINGAEINDTQRRKTKVFDIPLGYKAEDIWNDLAKTVFLYVDKYALKFNFGFSNMESFQILHYNAGDGFYIPHHDDGPSHNRICSAILYLNDVDEGGETHFNLFDISVKPKAGRLLIFPSNYPYVHEAKTPKSEDKFCIVTWFEK